jgi:hypothetical protein
MSRMVASTLVLVGCMGAASAQLPKARIEKAEPLDVVRDQIVVIEGRDVRLVINGVVMRQGRHGLTSKSNDSFPQLVNYLSGS